MENKEGVVSDAMNINVTYKNLGGNLKNCAKLLDFKKSPSTEVCN